MGTKKKLEIERERILQELNTLLVALKLNNKISTDFIVNLVYEAGTRWGDKAHLHFQKEIHKKMGNVKNPDDEFAVLQLAFECWNHFPHQDMDEKSPYERLEEKSSAPEAPKPNGPDVIVGDQKMSVDQFEAMLTEMEKVQAPFRTWLNTVLHSYKANLEEQYQPKTVEKHYSIAEILCDRILFVGFVSPEHVRPEFLYDEFPVWWQTHVMFGNYNETTVENSVVQFLGFIEYTTNVKMDAEYTESDLAIWS